MPLRASTAAATAGPMRIAVVIPSFRRGSGGPQTIAHLVRGLEHLGHDVSLWLEDIQGLHSTQSTAGVEREFNEFFGPIAGGVHHGFDAWAGADVAVATDWQTVARVLRLPGCEARAYLVQDHEPDFYPASAESIWAAETYRWGLRCIAASEWLAALLRERYGANATQFDLGVDSDLYFADNTPRRDDLVLFYARAATPRRAVPLGLLALTELHRRRPQLEIALFGQVPELDAPFPHRHLGILGRSELADWYRRGAVGMALSLTNPSLIPLEMLACGLAVVELDTEAIRSTYGAAPLELGAPAPLALADAVERLVADGDRRRRRAQAGLSLAAERTWAGAAGQVESGLRDAIASARREAG